jgi:hypothetical protein
LQSKKRSPVDDKNGQKTRDILSQKAWANKAYYKELVSNRDPYDDVFKTYLTPQPKEEYLAQCSDEYFESEEEEKSPRAPAETQKVPNVEDYLSTGTLRGDFVDDIPQQPGQFGFYSEQTENVVSHCKAPKTPYLKSRVFLRHVFDLDKLDTHVNNLWLEGDQEFVATGIPNTLEGFRFVAHGAFLLAHGVEDQSHYFATLEKAFGVMKTLPQKELGKWIYHLSCDMERSTHKLWSHEYLQVPVNTALKTPEEWSEEGNTKKTEEEDFYPLSPCLSSPLAPVCLAGKKRARSPFF